MKTLREYLDQRDRIAAPEPVAEGLRSSLAGAAVAATTAMTPATAADRVEYAAAPTLQQQIAQAIQAGDVPRGSRYQARTRGGWVTEVTVDGRTYDIRDRIPAQGQRQVAAADYLRSRMQEQELSEDEPLDPIQKIDQLFRDA